MSSKTFPLIFLLLFLVQNSPAWQSLNSKLDLRCSQDPLTQLDCEYRLLKAETADSIKASLGGNELVTKQQSSLEAQTELSAILFLVDTSDPKRQNVIEKNIEHISSLLDASGSHHLLGLANFDKALHIKAPVGAAKSQILTASTGLQALGMTTELYRNVLESIKILEEVEADKKAIIVFSDGQAEDKAYFHQDVVNAARNAGIIINSIGYPRSVSLSVALQTLRRLSDDTGGKFVEADASLNLPESFFIDAYKNIDKGRKLTIKLDDVDFAAIIRPQVKLTFQTQREYINVYVPIDLPLIRQKPSPQENVAEPVAPSPQVPPPAQAMTPQVQTQPQGLDLWLWYGVPIALIVLIILTLTTLFLLYKKPVATSSKQTTKADEFRPYAYLITQDEKGLRYPILRTIWRIGRSKDNEMTLSDNSISRRHAEIQRDANGDFILLDTNSSNGVFVNNEKITKHKLQEGDIVEIGDVLLRFTQRPIDYQHNEQTAMLSTKLPA